MSTSIESSAIESVTTPLTFTCLYCNRIKPAEESSLEHAIPQFLGGAQAPHQYKLRNACKSCNNTLGLHVDASFARSWNVANTLAMAARELYTGPGKGALPLICLGPVHVPELNVPQGMTTELWAGPSGENIVWLRHYNEAMYWYTGGNPIDKKNKLSTVYFLPTTNDEEGFKMGLEAFNEAFKKAKVRRIFGVPLVGVPAGTLFPGFDAPTDEELAALQVIRKYTSQANGVQVKSAWNLEFDLRFICKMVLAVGYSLFGEMFLSTRTATEARLGLKQQPERETELRGQSSLQMQDEKLKEILGYPGAITLTIMRGEVYTLSLNVHQRLSWTSELAPRNLTSPYISNAGYALLLFPLLNEAFELKLTDIMSHKLGRPHPRLEAIDKIARKAQAFNAALLARLSQERQQQNIADLPEA